jgi:hypothetical protein
MTWAKPFISACAWSIVTPGFKRPMSVKSLFGLRAARCKSTSAWWIQMSVSGFSR